MAALLRTGRLTFCAKFEISVQECFLAVDCTNVCENIIILNHTKLTIISFHVIEP